MLVGTHAERLVVLHLTVGIGSALGLVAGVFTLAVAAAIHHTGQFGTTVPVCGALIWTGAALDERVPN